VVTFIGGCHSGDIVAARDELTIASTYVFKTKVGLASTGTTWSYGPEELYRVTAALAKGQTLGEAWLAKQKARNTSTYYKERYSDYGRAFNPLKHMFGEIFFGDPFVTVK